MREPSSVAWVRRYEYRSVSIEMPPESGLVRIEEPGSNPMENFFYN